MKLVEDHPGPQLKARLALVAGSFAIAAAPSLFADFPAGDLHTHLYNAWLGNLVADGHVNGLWLAPAWTNSLISRGLAALLESLSPGAAEKVIHLALAEGFLWASFAYCRAVTRNGCWEWLPAIAMLAIGWTFQAGLVNWFASAALSLAAAALLLHPGKAGLRLPLAGVTLLVAATGNPFPPLWAGSSVALAMVHRRSPALGRRSLIVLSSGIFVAGGVTVLLGRGAYARHQLYALLGGADQLWVYDSWYAVLSGALLVIWGAAAIRLYQAPHPVLSAAMVVAIYSLVFVLAVPDAIIFPGYKVPAFYLARRGSLLAGVAVTAAMAQAQYSPRRTSLLACAAALWLALLAVDWSAMSRLQRNMDQAITTLPRGSRVVSAMGNSLFDPALYRSCTGRCFVWSDYQPSSGAFRVRAEVQNNFVVGRFEDYLALETGSYRLPELPFPVWEVAPCESPAPAENVCLRLLSSGDVVRKGCVQHISGWPWRRVASRCSL